MMNGTGRTGWRVIMGAGLSLLLFSGGVQARIDAATGTADRQTQPLTRSQQVTLTWRVTAAPAGQAITSSRLELGVADGAGGCRPLQTVSRRLDRVTDASGRVVFRETVVIPTAVAVQARRLGHGRVALCRSFDDADHHPRTAQVLLTLQSGGIGSAELSISHIRLRLDNGETVATVSQGAPLYATAWLRHAGQGVLRGVWEVAGPMVGAADPSYRIIGTLHRRVQPGERLILRSPPLPTQRTGAWQVRLRLLSPAVSSPALVLRYYVRGRAASGPAHATAIRVMAPAEEARIRPETPFAWRHSPGTQSYLLMLREVGHDAMTGMLMPAAADEGGLQRVRLSRFVRHRLKAGQVYEWWVEARDAQGRLTGRSTPRRVIWGVQ